MPFEWTTTQPNNRIQSLLPKVGIRPIVDGRRLGIRESLENVTMKLADRVALLIRESVRHSCGLAVETVVPNFCIGGVREAAKCSQEFQVQGVGVSLSVTPAWCYGAETMDMDPYIPKAIWGFNGTERPGAVYLAAVLAAHAQKGLPAFGIYGHDVQDAEDTNIPSDVSEKIITFVKAAISVATIRGTSYLAIGGVSMGISGSIIDPNFLERHLGMRYEMVDMTEFVRRLNRKIYDREEFDYAFKWAKEHFNFAQDSNPSDIQHSQTDQVRELEDSIKMTLIAKDLMIGNPKLVDLGFGEEALGHNAIAAGFQGQRQWTDHLPNGDILETILNSSFDWSGIRQPYIMATENDYLNGITMLLGHLISGTAQIFADVRTYWSPEAIERVTGIIPSGLAEQGILHLINSGSAALDGTGKQKIGNHPAMKPYWEITPSEVKDCLQATNFHPAILEYFRGGGYSTEFETEGNMPVTISRINLVSGIGPTLQIAEGYTVSLPKEISTVLIQRTNPTWPTTWFVPNLNSSSSFKDTFSVMDNWGANHCVISYGHIGANLITLYSILRIPISMHNVPENKIFRPKAWSMFGPITAYDTDYRACNNFGPLY